MIGEGAENGHTPRPSNNSYENNPDKNPDAVNGHIPFGRPPAPYKGLMIFVKGGEAYAEQAGHKHERDASKAINIEGEGDGYGQNNTIREEKDNDTGRKESGFRTKRKVFLINSNIYFIIIIIPFL